MYCCLRDSLAALFLLFLCSVPIAYITVASDSVWPYLYISMRIGRFILAAAVGFWVRRRYYKVIYKNEPLRKKSVFVVAVCICVGVLLHITNISEKLYLSMFARIYSPVSNTDLLLAILCEQLFSGDLYWSILICIAIVCFRFRKQDNSEENS